jgi:hypothetical protein
MKEEMRMKMYTDKFIVDGTCNEVDNFIEDFKRYFSFTIIDDDSDILANKRKTVIKLLNGESLGIDNKKSEEK